MNSSCAWVKRLWLLEGGRFFIYLFLFFRQFMRVGQGAMVAGKAAVIADVLPYSLGIKIIKKYKQFVWVKG
jgi:hypothetical protein